MQTKFQRFGAMVLSAALALSLSAPALAAEGIGTQPQEPKLASAVSDGTFLRGTFTFKANENEKDLTDTFIYSDSYFSQDSGIANEHLATMSMQLASASISSRDADYPEKSQNVTALLDVLGFQKVEVNDCYKQKMDTNTMGVAVGYKPLDDNKRSCWPSFPAAQATRKSGAGTLSSVPETATALACTRVSKLPVILH